MRDAILRRAAELGFDAAGVSPVEPLPETGRYLEWIEEGFHAGMTWMEKTDPRLNPEHLLPGVNSIVSLAMFYGEGESGDGGVSRYARGRDYHGVMLERARSLARFIREEGGGEARAFVDAAPVLEKYWAWRAGLGWPGKHTNLVNRRFGSWFFLGEVLTTLCLEPDEAEVRDACGTCRRCLDACPTGALTAPHRLDARRCLSYLTIEHRGDIPEEFVPALGSSFFGCDACLAACPWNRFSPRSEPTVFDRPDVLPLPAEILSWSGERFRRETADSPLRRAGRGGLLRNAAIVLGNAGNRESVGPLSRALGDPDPVVRKAVVGALIRLGGEDVRGILEAHARREDDDAVRLMAARFGAGETSG